MRKGYLISLFLFISGGVWSQITQWTFETSIPATAGPHAAEAGTGSATGLHASGSTVYNNPLGNGSPESFSSNFWALGDYYQFQFPTIGFQNISITWDATGSSTGPRDFKVQYSTDGSVFTDATGTNSTYSLTTETWSSVTYNPVSARTLDLSSVIALNNTAAVYIRLVVNSATSIGGASIGTGGTSRVDNFTVNGTAISPNTISAGALSALTFNIDCFTDGTGTVDFTSAGTFNAGNDYSVQLSNAVGSFASAIVIGTLTDNTANSGTINIAIPAGTPTGTGYLVRVVSNDPVVISSNTSATININLSGVCVSAATDYFRSKITGNWNATTTWQTSATGLAGTWIDATLTPTSAANTIQIRNGHTVSITSAESADQLVIESGGILNQVSGTFTIDDGPGDDVDIQNGAVFTLSFINNPPLFGTGNPVVNVATGGILRVSAAGITPAAPANGVNAANYVYQHQSILEFTLNGAFVTGSNVVYFPNVNAATIPIFRTTANSPTVMNVGAGTPTTFNGIFEAGGTATIRWQNGGNKIFRNGIRGPGNMDYEAASIASAKFIINGTTAELGGAGSLSVPPAGLEAGSSTTVTMISDKAVTGNISLLNDTYIDPGIYDLTVSGIVSNATITSYVRTLSTGALTLLNVGPGLAGKLFPVGRTTINPVLIRSTPAETFSARIVEPITPPIYNDNFSVLRTWYLSCAAATAPSTSLTFGYTYPTDCGASFVNSGANAQVGVHIGGTWNIHQSNLTPAAFSYPGTFTITPTNPFTGFITGTEFPFVIANNGSILSIDCIIAVHSRKVNNSGLISWEVSTCSEISVFEIQRSVGNGGFQTIGRVIPGTALAYNYTDANLAGGTNLYRIKINGINGDFKYSNTVAVINAAKGLLITALSPNPVTDNAALVINAAKPGTVNFTIYSISGQALQQWQAMVTEGSNTIPIATSGLAAGIYHLAAATPDGKTVIRFLKQ